MRESLQGRAKAVLAAVFTAIVLFGGCSKTQPDTAEPSISSSNEILTVTEINIMNNSNNNIVNELSSLLGCSERTATSVLKDIERSTETEISSVTAENDGIGTKLTVTDKNGDVFIVFMGKGYFVQEIFRDNENGERIYFAME